MSSQNQGLAALIAAQGRNGDDELIHVNKRELAAIERLGRQHGIDTTTNPKTGLKEAFNWGSTIGGVLGGIGGTFAAPFTGGIINPYTGAALGSAAGTKLSGGSNEDALMNGAIAGVTAWGLGGASDALGSLGQEATKEAAKETANTAVQTGVQTGVEETTKAGAQNLATNILPDAGYYGAESLGQQGVNTYTSQGTKEMLAAGANPNLTTSIGPGQNTLMASGANPDYWSNVSKGIQSLDTPGKVGEFAMQNKGSLLAGGLGAYALGSGAGNQSNPEAPADQTSSVGYRGEVYYTPYGERRTRAVALAGGGLSSLGGYSDGGQLLRGAGDGVSDSIPATIADKQPARLADGEFVVPARAVSELGNGSTEAGAKQLYAMLDRIAKKRKKGSGLAYQANPKKLMPA